MAQLNPWDESYVDPNVATQTQGANPWDEGYVDPSVKTAPVPAESGYPGQPSVSQAELDVADNTQAPGQASLFDGTYDPSMDPSLIPGAPEAEQRVQDQGLANQYKDYESGTVIQKPDNPGVAVDRGTSSLDNVVPSTDMYNGVQDPRKFYEALSTRAKEHTLFGDPVVNGKVVPEPGQYDWFQLGNSNPTMPYGKVNSLVGDAGREAVKNTLLWGAATIDEMSGTDTLAKKVNQMIADPPKAGGVDSVIKDSVKIVGASVLGAKGAVKGGQLISNNQTLANGLAALGGIVSGVAVMNPDDPTVITGRTALAPLLQGAQNKDGTYSGEIVANKLNQMSEAFMLAYPGAKAAEAAAWAGGVVNKLVIKPIMYGIPTAGQKTRIEQKTAQEVISQLTSGDATQADISKIVQYMKENRETIFEMGDSKIPDAVVARTPMSALHEGATKAGDYLLANKAMDVEAGAMRKGIPELTTRKEEPIRALQEVQQAAVDSRGGLGSIDKTRQLMANEAISKTTAADDNLMATQLKGDMNIDQVVRDNQVREATAKNEVTANTDKASADLEMSNNELKRIHESDPTFAATINELSKDTGIDVAGRFKANATSEIMPKLVQAVKEVKDKKNALYNAIPEGAEIDLKSFTDSVVPLVENNWLPKRLEDSIASKLKPDDEMDSIDFKYINNEILPKVNAEISREVQMGANANRDKIRALKDLRENITDTQMDHLIKSKNPDVAKAANDAREYYKYTYMKYARDSETPVGQVFMAYDDAYDAHLAKLSDEGKITDLGSNYKVTDTAQRAVESSVTDNRRGSSQQVIDFLSEPEYAGDPSDLMKVYKGEVAGAIGDALSQNGRDVSALEPELIYKTLKDKGVVLKHNFPEQVREIETFINHFKSAKLSQAASENQLKLAQEEGQATLDRVGKENKDLLSTAKDTAKAETKGALKEVKSAKKEIKKSALNKFVEETPNGLAPKENGYDIMKGILRKDNNEVKLKDIAARVKKSGDKEAQDGLESSYFSVQQDLINATVNDKKVNATNAKKVLSDKTSMRRYGEIVFGNRSDPKEAEAGVNTLRVYNKLVDGVLAEQAKTSNSSIPLTEKIGVQKEATTAFGYLTRFVFGALSRTGTKVSSTGGRVISFTDPDTIANDVYTKLVSDNDYAEKVFTALEEKMKSGISPDERKALIQAGILLAGRESIDTTNKTKEYFNGEDKSKVKVPNGVILLKYLDK